MTDHQARRTPGEDTRDLRHTTNPDPNGDHAQEQRTQRTGNRLVVAGFTAIALTVILSLGVSMAYREDPFPNPDAKIFGNLVFVTLMVTGATLIGVGLAERRQRGSRARHMASTAAAHERGEQMYLLMQRHVLDTEEPLNAIMATQATNTGRLGAIERSLQLLISQLPAEMQRQHWVGFNAAVQEGFGEQTGTGTEGRARRPGHLGLVPPTEIGEIDETTDGD